MRITINIALREQQIRADGIRKQLVNLLPSSASMMLMGMIVALVAQEHTGWGFAASWFACVALISASRIVLHQVYKNPERKASDDELVRYALGASFASGLAWGIGAFIAHFYAPAFMLNLIVPMIVMLGAVATFASASYLPAFKLFFFGAALPVIATFFIAGKYALGVGFLIYVAIMSRASPALGQGCRAINRCAQLEHASNDCSQSSRGGPIDGPCNAPANGQACSVFKPNGGLLVYELGHVLRGGCLSKGCHNS